MRRSTVLLSIAFVALSSEAFARTGWCGNFARHNLVGSDPGSQYNLACNWRNWGRPTSAQVGAMVIWCSSRHRHAEMGRRLLVQRADEEFHPGSDLAQCVAEVHPDQGGDLVVP